MLSYLTTLFRTFQNSELSTVRRRNIKKLMRVQVEDSFSRRKWAEIYRIGDVDKALEYLISGITDTLDDVAPFRIVKIRRTKCLYLARDTLNLMKLCNTAKGARYRKLRNRCSVLVERDKRFSNESKLAKSAGDSRILW
jgi:hypothetical protein